MSRIIKINDVEFEARSDCNYKHDYYEFADRITGGEDALSIYRYLILNDLWFNLKFVWKAPCDHPFLVQACRDVEDGPRSNTLDLWARGHFKSSIITQAEVVQDIVRSHGFPEIRNLAGYGWNEEKEERIGVFSYSRSAALDFFHAIKGVLESSEFLQACFPDVLYKNPQSESDRWSDEFGLNVRRKTNAKEATLQACGLLDGMPTRMHFTKVVFDDIVTDDAVDNPDMMIKLERKFFIAQNLVDDGGRVRIVGTIYHHNDLLSKLRERKYLNGTSQYHVRVKPATEDGEVNGKSVFQSETKMAELRMDLESFYCQQLLNPTPSGTAKLNKELVRVVSPGAIPGNIWRFMGVDAAGEKATRKADSWALVVGGFEPFVNEAGLSNLYLLDLKFVKASSLEEAIQEAVKMYLRNGYIRVLGVEKVAISTTEIHVASALRAKGRLLTLEAGNLAILRPEGRSKQERIEQALKWPLLNGKIHLSSAIAEEDRNRLLTEMDKYPRWHDDGLDICAYLYDLAKKYQFGRQPGVTDPQLKDRWDRAFERREKAKTPWLVA